MTRDADDLELRDELPLGAFWRPRFRPERLVFLEPDDVAVFRGPAQLGDSPECAPCVAIDSDARCWWCDREGVEREAVASLTTSNRTSMCEQHLRGWFGLLDALKRMEPQGLRFLHPLPKDAGAQRGGPPSEPRGSQSDGPPYLGRALRAPRAAGGNRPKGEKTRGEE